MEVLSSAFINDANLKAYWRLENVNDSKNSYNLTNNNTVTFTGAKYGNGANFGSSNTNKSLSINSNLTISGGAMSVSLWVKMLAEISSGTQTLFSLSDSATDTEMFIRYEYNSGTRRIRLDRTKRGDTNNPIYYNVTLGTDVFHHIALTYDASALKGYYNGTYFDQLATSGSGLNFPSAIDHTTLGRSQFNDGTFTSYASALIDDVAVFNDELTATEVKTIYTDAGGSFIFNMI